MIGNKMPHTEKFLQVLLEMHFLNVCFFTGQLYGSEFRWYQGSISRVGLQVINMTRSLMNSRTLSNLSHCVKKS